MFRKGSKTPDGAAEGPQAYDTVLGAGSRVEGDVVVRGSVRILGEVEGAVEADGDLEVEMGAAIRGGVKAERASIAGRVEGDVRVRDSLELRRGAHLRGDVYAKSFRIQDGAVFQGNCHMGRDFDEEPARQASPGGLPVRPR
ncbi:MAG: polymer-forming cytoskeletal protein [Candidatus Eisenbacteria bacterium]|nr:polymer-forming cytoskeletal protein [Candidatus Eisenbacteria bacterium]